MSDLIYRGLLALGYASSLQMFELLHQCMPDQPYNISCFIRREDGALLPHLCLVFYPLSASVLLHSSLRQRCAVPLCPLLHHDQPAPEDGSSQLHSFVHPVRICC